MSALSRQGYDGVPTQLQDPKEWCQKISIGVNNQLRGRLNVTYAVTFTPSSTTTTLVLPEGVIGNNSFIAFQPLTANAAAATGYYAIGNPNTNTITITHASTATTDRNFRILVIG